MVIPVGRIETGRRKSHNMYLEKEMAKNDRRKS